MIAVSSTNLSAVGYDSSNRILTILFRSGHLYEYYGVPQNIFEGLLSAPSKGKFHHRYIKNSYRYNRIR